MSGVPVDQPSAWNHVCEQQVKKADNSNARVLRLAELLLNFNSHWCLQPWST